MTEVTQQPHLMFHRSVGIRIDESANSRVEHQVSLSEYVREMCVCMHACMHLSMEV